VLGKLGSEEGRLVPRAAAALVAVALLAVVVAVRGPGAGGSDAATARIKAYRGLGTWIDIYDASWSDPAGAVASMKARGVRTLFLETSNFNRPSAFVDPDGVRAFVDAAHRQGLSIVAWYLPGFDDVDRDVRRSMAAIRYRTPSGNRFDSFALDIESPTVVDPAVRTRRLLELSERLRSTTGDRYPLGAIVPSPRAVRRNKDYWPGFPWRRLGALYDVFLPMTYFTWRVSGEDGAHSYTAGNIEIIREETGDATVPIHVIGGIAGDATSSETAGFVHALRERGAIGASYYTFPLIRDGDWRSLSTVPANPVEDPALPLSFGRGDEVGNVPGSDTTHPKEVVYRIGGIAGGPKLVYQAFDLQKGEVRIFVNWHRLAHAAPTDAGAWSETRGRLIPDELLNDTSSNYIAFVARGSDPDWSVWGVREVDLAVTGPAPSPSPTPTPSATTSQSPTPSLSPSPTP
jgi:hypothetical protein